MRVAGKRKEVTSINRKLAFGLLASVILALSIIGASFSVYAAAPDRSTTVTEKIIVVYDQDLTAPSSVTDYVYLASFDTTGFKKAYLMAQATGTGLETASMYIWIYENNFGVKVPPSGGFGGSIDIHTGSDTYKPDYGAGKTNNFYEIHSTTTDLYFQVYNSAFDGHLKIVAYLST